MEVCGSLSKHVEACGNLWEPVKVCGSLRKHVEAYGSMWKFEETCGCLWRCVEACGSLRKHVESVEACGSILHDTCTMFRGFRVCACVSVCTQAQVLVDMHGVCISDPGHSCNVGVSGVGGGACMHMYV